ncbi:MAG: chalcone isomerase family protein [Candidatus Kapabacteria bacterium]|nr:chalcone isomerase family protein [Candidatus Kapabacteria bacterium]
MKKYFTILLFLCFSFAAGKNIGGITLPETLKSDGQNLSLNGCGIITKFFLKVYAIGIYLEAKSGDENAILNADKPYTIRMHFLRSGISADKINDAWKEGFEKATGGNTGQIQKEIAQFKSYFNFEINENMIFQFEYKPGVGTKIYINDKLNGVIPGFAFKRALIGIWIGSDPRDKGVKKELLGK